MSLANQLLVYSRTDGFRHESIPQAITTIRSFGYNATFSEDPTLFSSQDSLSQYKAIVFFSTTGEVLNADEKGNFQVWLSRGGGFVGIHSATSTFMDTSFFGDAIGASFSRHPECQNATFVVLDSNHPSTANLPTQWTFSEEVYNFVSDPRATNASLLLSVDEDSYHDQYKPGPGHAQGAPHPISWFRDGQAILRANRARPWTRISNNSWDSDGMFRPPGRIWYTGLGHREETWRDETFQSHIQGGIDWVLGVNTTKPKVTISSNANNRTGTPDVSEKGAASANAMPTSRVLYSALSGLIASTFLLHLTLAL